MGIRGDESPPMHQHNSSFEDEEDVEGLDADERALVSE